METATDPGLEQKGYSPSELLFFSVLFFIPVLDFLPFVWLTGLMAVPVFYLLTVKGPRTGGRLLRNSLLIAGAGAFLLRRPEIFLFSLTLLPLGYALFQSVIKGESAMRSGVRGLFMLILSWLLFWTAYGTAAGINVYNNLLENLDAGFRQVLELYSSEQAGLSPEELLNVRQLTDGIRETLPKILPSLLALMAVATVWLNMLVANNLLGHKQKGLFPWGKYSTWKLPDQLPWASAGAIVCILLSPEGVVQQAGIFVLLLSGQLYFFQGLAVFIFLLDRWNMPVYLRVIVYPMVILLPYGTLLLSFLGLFEVWFQFRRKKEQNHRSS